MNVSADNDRLQNSFNAHREIHRGGRGGVLMFINGTCRAELNDGRPEISFGHERAFLTKIMAFVRLAARSLTHSRLALLVPRTQSFTPWRAGFATPAGLTKEVIETRIIDVLKGFENVNASKVTLEPSLLHLTALF